MNNTINMQRVNAFLRSEAATLLLLAMALIAQTPHAATVFWRAGNRFTAGNEGWIIAILVLLHSVTYAIALEAATLMFVVRGQKKLAWLFAAGSVCVNIAYYADWSMTWGDMLRAALISIALPASIAFYSHSVADASEPVAEPTAKPRKAATPIAQPLAEIAPLATPLQLVQVIAESPQRHAESPQADDDMARKQNIARMMKGEGLSNVKIAQQLQVSVSTVGRWFKKEVVA